MPVSDGAVLEPGPKLHPGRVVPVLVAGHDHPAIAGGGADPGDLLARTGPPASRRARRNPQSSPQSVRSTWLAVGVQMSMKSRSRSARPSRWAKCGMPGNAGGAVVHRRDDPEPIGDSLAPEESGEVRLPRHSAQPEQGAPTRRGSQDCSRGPASADGAASRPRWAAVRSWDQSTQHSTRLSGPRVSQRKPSGQPDACGHGQQEEPDVLGDQRAPPDDTGLLIGPFGGEAR